MRRATNVKVVVMLAIVATLGLAAMAAGQAREVVGAPVPSPVIEGTGGPDGYGYTWIDSNEPGGPTYSWVDITGTGTAIVGLTDDNLLGPFPVGFSFPFYGTAYTDFYASSNGWIGFEFGTGTSALTNQCPLPDPGIVNNLIAMLWDDLNFSTSGAAHYQYFAACPVGSGECTVVEYSNVAHYGGVAGSAGTWEAILYADGKVLIQFQDPGAETGSGSTTGIEGPAATFPTYGLAFACNTGASLAANLAVRFELAGWTLTSPDTSKSGARGDVVNYTLTITNHEATARTFDISHSGNVWPTSHPATVGPVASGASQDFTVAVTIPWTIGQCEVDTVVVSVADQAAPGSPKTLGLTTSGPGGTVLYDNGPLVTHPAGGFGGADASALQTALGLTTYGAGNQVSAGNRLADDFIVPAGETWTINEVRFFEYQTASGTTSPFTAVNYQIWNGPPNAGGVVIWGDTTTNRLVSSAWSSIYRVLDTALTNADRPVMALTCSGGASLTAGTYWIDWQADGSASFSGPWQPPISILGQTTTGNALQYTTTGWANLVDGTFAQGLPFILNPGVCQAATDWGDANAPYPTLAAANGARHLIPGQAAPNVILGALIDAEDNGQPSPTATGDDGNGLADEDGVAFMTAIVPNTIAGVQVTASGNTFLQAWMDFNHDGDWDDAGEQIFINQPLVAGPNALTFPVPLSAIVGDTVARFRVCTEPALGYSGAAPNGEVEDYLVTTTPVELQSFTIE